MKDDKTRSLQVAKGSDTAEVLKASQPYGLLSKTTATVSTALSSKVVSMSLARLEKVGMIQEQRTTKIEKNGRPEKIYRVTSTGVAWLQSNGFEKATVLAMSDPIDLAHRYCQMLVGVQSSAKVEVEKIIPLADGRNIRFDVGVPLSKGILQFIEIEQKLDRNNITRAIEKFRALGELFNAETSKKLFSSEILFVFNLSAASLPRTLNVWRDALALVFPWDAPLPFTPRYTTIDAFVYDPEFENLRYFPLIEKRKNDKQYPAEVRSGGELFSPTTAPSTKKLLVELNSIPDQPVSMPTYMADQLAGFCEIAMTIYRKSNTLNSQTRKYSAFPQESIQTLKQFLHLPQNAGLLQGLKEGVAGIISKQSGLIVYRDAVTKLLWDVFLRFFGFGRGGPLDVYVKIPDLGDKASQIQIDVIITKSDSIILPWTSAEETYEDAISWMLTALVMYAVDLGLSSSLWSSARQKKSEVN